jgi:hypothetical protein
MASVDLSRWYYPPGRPVEEGRVFADPSLVPAGWGVDPSPPAVGAELLPNVVDRAEFDAAVTHAADALDLLEKANARIAELEAQVAALETQAAGKSKKARASSSDAADPSDPTAPDASA